MDIDSLLLKGENSRIEFKRQWYKIEDFHGELVKDLLSVANGGLETIGQTGYMLIGIEDTTKKIFDFDKSTLGTLEDLNKQLNKKMNDYSQPAFPALDLRWERNGKVLVLEISPHNYLISLSRPLEKNKIKHPYKKGTTFYRQGDSICVAGEDIINLFHKEMSAIRQDPLNKAKKLYTYLQKQKSYFALIHYEAKKIDYLRSANFLHNIKKDKLQGLLRVFFGNKLEKFRIANQELNELRMKRILSEAELTSGYSTEMMNDIDSSIQFNFHNLVESNQKLKHLQKKFYKKTISIVESRSSVRDRERWDMIWFLLSKARDEGDLQEYDEIRTDLLKEIDQLSKLVAKSD